MGDPLFWVKIEEMREGRKASWKSKSKPAPTLSSRSASATERYGCEFSLCHFFFTSSHAKINLSYKIEFDLQENEPVGRSRFHIVLRTH